MVRRRREAQTRAPQEEGRRRLRQIIRQHKRIHPPPLRPAERDDKPTVREGSRAKQPKIRPLTVADIPGDSLSSLDWMPRYVTSHL